MSGLVEQVRRGAVLLGVGLAVVVAVLVLEQRRQRRALRRDPKPLHAERLRVAAVDVRLTECRVVHPARAVLGARHQPQAEGALTTGTLATTESAIGGRAVRHGAEGAVELEGRPVQGGVLGDVLDGAAHRALAVERALGATQHLDPLEVEQAHVEAGADRVEVDGASST